MAMSALHCGRVIMSTLNRSVIPLPKALSELRQVLNDEDAGKHLDGLLASWARVCLGIVAEDDCFKLDDPRLNHRQRWMLDRCVSVGRITVQDCKDKFGGAYSAETYRLDLCNMVDLGLLRAVGRTKARVYIPASDGASVTLPDGGRHTSIVGNPDVITIAVDHAGIVVR